MCAKLFMFTRNIESRISDRNPKFRFFQEFKSEKSNNLNQTEQWLFIKINPNYL